MLEGNVQKSADIELKVQPVKTELAYEKIVEKEKLESLQNIVSNQ